MRRSRARTVVNWNLKASSVPVVSVDVVIHVRNNRTVPECNATAYSTAGRRAGSQGNVCGCGRKAGQFCNFVSGSGSQPHDMEAGLGWAGLQRQSIRCQMLDARWQMADGGPEGQRPDRVQHLTGSHSPPAPPTAGRNFGRNLLLARAKKGCCFPPWFMIAPLA